jgi:DNA invertase Pin-like site-specific DNA recombinase
LIYLRASTDEQDASRARISWKAFATERCLTIAAWYVENESGT